MKITIRNRLIRIKMMGLFCGLWVLTMMSTLTEGAEINRNTAAPKQLVRAEDGKFKGAWAHSRLSKPPKRPGIKVLPGTPSSEKMKKNIALEIEARQKPKQQE